MMDDAIYTGRVSDLIPLINTIGWSTTETLMILELVPTRWLDQAEIDKGICFLQFDTHINFNQWQVGRIFDPHKEFLWQTNDDGQFQVIYTGKVIGLSELNSIDVDWQSSQTSYMLWGRSLKSEELKILGIQEDSAVFLELQLPRLLYYPVSVKKDKKCRLQLKVL